MKKSMRNLIMSWVGWGGSGIGWGGVKQYWISPRVLKKEDGKQ